MGFIKEFRDFAMKGNAIDMAVGIVIGAAFSGIVNSLVSDIITPLLGLLSPEKMNLSSLELNLAGDVQLKYGAFLDSILSFLVISFAIFIVIRQMNRIRIPFLSEEESEEKPATTRECPFCCSTIPIKATRCPQCTTMLPSGADTPKLETD